MTARLDAVVPDLLVAVDTSGVDAPEDFVAAVGHLGGRDACVEG